MTMTSAVGDDDDDSAAGDDSTDEVRIFIERNQTTIWMMTTMASSIVATSIALSPPIVQVSNER